MFIQNKLIYSLRKWHFVALTLVLLAATATSVFAETEQPPVVDTEPVPLEEPAVEGSPPLEGESPVEEVVVAETLVEETSSESAVEETPADAVIEEPAPLPEEQPVVEAGEADVSTDETVVEEIASDTATEEISVIEEAAEAGAELVDADGEPLTLASEKSSELLSSADPYYSVGLTTYNFYAGAGPVGCAADPTCFEFQGSNVIQDALNYMNTSGLPTDRKLYVEAGTYDGFSVNGFSDPWLALLNGIIGVDGSDSTFITSNVTISNNIDGFTFSGFTINNGGSLYFGDNTGSLLIQDVQVKDSTNGVALQVSNHSGSVTMEAVNVSDNDYHGAQINNTIGSYPITINNSAFNGNGLAGSGFDAGLTAISNNIITLNGVAANANKGNGITISNFQTLRITDAFLSGNFSPIGGYGVALNTYTPTTGTAYLEHVYAYGNDYGIQIEGGSLHAKYIEVNDTLETNGLTFFSDVGSARVEFGDFHNNDYTGLSIYTKGSIYLNSVRADNNVNGQGVYLNNAYWDGFNYVGSGSIQITSPKSGGAQLANSFNNNGERGIAAVSQGGVIIRNFTASNNVSDGITVDNTLGSSGVTIEKNLTDWINWITDNGSDGLNVYSNGTVKIKDTYAMGNDGEGFYVYVNGAIELINIYAESNLGDGAYLSNQNAPFPKTIKITNGRFDHNQGYGIVVYTKGSITANGLTANGNSLRDHYFGTSAVVQTYRDLIGAEWVEDIYTFTATAGDWVDLHLESADFDAYLVLIDPDGIEEAFDNDGWYDTNSHIGLNVAKTGTYTVLVRSNGYSGAGEYFISLNDEFHSTVNGWSYSGAYLANNLGIAPVTINKPKDLNLLWGNFFDLNTYDGLRINSFGSIKIDSANASGNFGYGLNLSNWTSKGSVTVTNLRKDGFQSEFNNNDYYGILINTLGNVTVQNILANNNANDGMFIDNCQWDTDHCAGFGGVKILASSNRSNEFSGNGWYGFEVYSKGSIQLVNTFAEGNVYDGVYLYNAYDGATGSVKVSTSGKDGWNGFFVNGYDGLSVRTNGTITISKVTAVGNAFYGADLSNSGSPASPFIKINDGHFFANGQYGLSADSKGNIIYNRGAATDNGLTGASLINTFGTGNVSVKGTTKALMDFSSNGWAGGPGYDGLAINSYGTITLGFAKAENNNGHGFELINGNAPSPKAISINDVQAHNNLNRGLWGHSLGAIKVNGVSAIENGWEGVYLDNDDFGASGNVTVGTTRYTKVNTLDSNQGVAGLSIKSLGSVSIKNTNASNNTINGITVQNADGTGSVSLITTRSENFHLSGNGQHGLYIHSGGNVTIKNKYKLMVYGNAGDGIFVWSAAVAPMTVVIENVDASENKGNMGILINASGNVLAKSLTAQSNGYDGVNITSAFGNVIVSGTNRFADNAWSGLYIVAMNGNITISGVTAWSNGQLGINALSDIGDIKVTNTIAAHNNQSGLLLESNGNFYLNNVKAFLNGQDDGGWIWDDGLAILAGVNSLVDIRYSSFMTNWWGSGIEIVHPDALFVPTLYNVNYLSNDGPNLYVHT